MLHNHFLITSNAEVYILRRKSTNPPPPFPDLHISPEHTFSQTLDAVFLRLKGEEMNWM